MATLAELQAWRDNLFESRLKGIREVEDQNGERITYKSDSEMAAAIAAADRAIAAAQSGQPNTIVFRTSKGL
jgi:hypothetical protein